MNLLALTPLAGINLMVDVEVRVPHLPRHFGTSVARLMMVASGDSSGAAIALATGLVCFSGWRS